MFNSPFPGLGLVGAGLVELFCCPQHLYFVTLDFCFNVCGCRKLFRVSHKHDFHLTSNSCVSLSQTTSGVCVPHPLGNPWGACLTLYSPLGQAFPFIYIDIPGVCVLLPPSTPGVGVPFPHASHGVYTPLSLEVFYSLLAPLGSIVHSL